MYIYELNFIFMFIILKKYLEFLKNNILKYIWNFLYYWSRFLFIGWFIIFDFFRDVFEVIGDELEDIDFDMLKIYESVCFILDLIKNWKYFVYLLNNYL